MSTRLVDTDRPHPYTAAVTSPVDIPPSPTSAPAEWSPALRVAFRLAFVYFGLYLFPGPVGIIPGVSKVGEWWDRLWHAIVPWLGAHVLRLGAPVNLAPSGSGDKLFDYIQNGAVLAVAVIATVVWSVLDRRRKEYARLHDWLRVFVRYSLAVIMLGYGAAKVIKSQFPAPGLERLVEPYGQFSPMGVVWAWMGYSMAYNVFTGLGEFVGAMLLFWRRTTLLGALLLIAVLANVVMINYAYDVPVKLFSTNLLLMAAFLALPDARRLVDVLVLNRAAAPARLGGFTTRDWRLRVGRLLLKAAVIALGAGMTLWQTWKGYTQFGDAAPRPPLSGIYDVAEFVRNGQVLPALVTDSTRWRRVVFGYPRTISVQMMSDSIRRYAAEVDTVHGRLTVSSRRDSIPKSTLAYVRAADGDLLVDGAIRGDTLHLRLHRVDHTKFLLLRRGYHWVNEVPYNR